MKLAKLQIIIILKSGKKIKTKTQSGYKSLKDAKTALPELKEKFYDVLNLVETDKGYELKDKSISQTITFTDKTFDISEIKEIQFKAKQF